MGNGVSNRNKDVQVGKASEFYLACRNGDYQKVKHLIANLNYEQLSQIEPNGSTALHAATHNGHRETVKLLLEHGCSRTTLNRYGHTAYDEAKTEQMRAIFHRPTSQRFVDAEPTQSFGLLSKTDDDVPDDWVKGYTSRSGAREASLMHAIAQAPLLMRKVLRTRLEEECKEELESFLEKTVGTHHPARAGVINHLNIYKKQKSVASLFTLYTMETPFYGALQNDCEKFTALLYMHLPALKDRAYQGIAYRGAQMTRDDIRAYQWTLAQRGRVLETRTIQSMSKSKDIALRFARNTRKSKPFSVLLIFNFPEVCRTAIDLAKISEFQGEEEVTLLPFTLFTVSNITVDTNDDVPYRITLQNIPVEKKSVVGALLGMS
ncbi:unnamed protein product [Adineta ricciae]|uniref:NAD(P)(+)--arginine ADP-ribosyltransferase n=1 Tax=Adineta ricciae TaxID=249248 RepID=A0A815LKD9_ADIRI|nr:unnamed protein product [Adineta ricciae]CAF1613384.1 unnamed protein product [Adineta ricciae]